MEKKGMGISPDPLAEGVLSERICTLLLDESRY